MKWIDDLEIIMREHLFNHHLEQPDLQHEVRMFVDFLIYNKFSEGEHTICCPFSECAWDCNFEIKYQMEIVWNSINNKQAADDYEMELDNIEQNPYDMG